MEDAALMGAKALHLQAHHRWRKLSEEKPPEEGWYLVMWTTSYPCPYNISYWHAAHGFGLAAITQWAHIPPPEED